MLSSKITLDKEIELEIRNATLNTLSLKGREIHQSAKGNIAFLQFQDKKEVKNRSKEDANSE